MYQLPSAEATLGQGTKIATFDLVNGVTAVLGIALDEESGVVLDVPLQVGRDSGLQRYVVLTRDALRGGPLVNGQQYYFAVTAYNRATSEEAATTTLESPRETSSACRKSRPRASDAPTKYPVRRCQSNTPRASVTPAYFQW